MPIETFRCSKCRKKVTRKNSRFFKHQKRYCSDTCKNIGQKAAQNAWVRGVW